MLPPSSVAKYPVPTICSKGPACELATVLSVSCFSDISRRYPWKWKRDGPVKETQLYFPSSAEENSEGGRVKHQAKVASPNVFVHVVANRALSLRQPLESTPTVGTPLLSVGLVRVTTTLILESESRTAAHTEIPPHSPLPNTRLQHERTEIARRQQQYHPRITATTPAAPFARP